jgi:hypothetical protein
MTAPDLPALPEPFFASWSRGGLLSADGYTADQMLAFRAEAIAARDAEIARLRAKLKDCGGDNCMGQRVDGVTQWITVQAAEARVSAALAAQQPAAVPAPFLFVAMDDDKKAHLTWCADEAAVRAATQAAMFFSHDGAPLDADHDGQLTGVVEELLDSGCMTFEGDAPLHLYRVASAAAPALQPPSTAQRLAEARECSKTFGCQCPKHFRGAPAERGGPLLTEIRQAVQNYYAALDARKHGGVAQDEAFRAIEKALGMQWVQGATLKRAGGITGGTEEPKQ